MKRKNKIVAVIVTLLLTLSILSVIQLSVSVLDEPAPYVGIRDIFWKTPDHYIGESFTVDLEIDAGTQNVSSWRAGFEYDPTILNCTAFENGTYFHSVGSATVSGGTIHPNGTVEALNVTLVSGSQNGTGVIATITFTILNYGKTVIDLNTTDLTECVVLDENQNPISMNIKDGSFELRTGVTVSLRPIFWKTPDHYIGESFTVDLEIETAENVSSWKAGFTYDPTILNCTAFENGTYFQGVGSATVSGGTRYPNGTVTSLNVTLVSGSQTGSGVLATITFTILNYGKTEIMLTKDDGHQCETLVLDQNGDECRMLDLVDGVFELRDGVAVSLRPIFWKTPDHYIGEEFTIDLEIDTAENVSAWQAGFRFDPTILECTTLEEGTYLSSVGSTGFIAGDIDNNNGVVEASLCYLQGEDVSQTGSGVLMKINFTILNYGKTTIELTKSDYDVCETLVLDQNGDECRMLYLVDGVFELRSGVTVSIPDVYWTTAGTHYIGETVTMELRINATAASSENVSAWQAGFRFDPTILECTALEEGTYLSSAGSTQFIAGDIDNNNGVVEASFCYLQGEDVSQTGSGVLMKINFTILNYGKTTIELTKSDYDVCETLVLDQNGDECRILILENGVFEFRSGVEVWIEPEETTRYVAPGIEFSVELWINATAASSENVSAWQAGFRYDNSKMEFVRIEEGTYLSSVGSTGFIAGVETSPGVVEASLCYLQGEGVSQNGSGVLAIITFECNGTGKDLINLTDLDFDVCETLVLDQNGDECSILTVTDGWVCQKLPGDVDGSGSVTSADLIFGLAPAYGSSDGQPNWNPEADFDYSGSVTSADLIFGLAPNYGTVYTLDC